MPQSAYEFIFFEKFSTHILISNIKPLLFVAIPYHRKHDLTNLESTQPDDPFIHFSNFPAKWFFFKENLRSFSQVIPKQKFNPIWALALQVTLFRRMTFKLFYLFPKWKFKPECMALPFSRIMTWSDLNLQYLRMIT